MPGGHWAPKVRRVCPCGKEFKTWPYLIRQGYGRHCSKQCGYSGRRNKHGDGKKRCTVCHTVFPRTIEHFYGNKQKRDGLTTECRDCCARVSKNRRLRAQEFIASFGNRCAHCGVHSDDYRFFDIDHITPLAVSRKKRTQYRYDNDDYQVLCPNCHRLKTIRDAEQRKAS